MDTLSGNLDTFPLDSVLRLIAGSDKEGVLKIEKSQVTGRIFIADNGVTYATTRAVDYGSGGAGDASKDRRHRSRRADSAFDSAETMVQQIVEVLVRMLRDRSGSFAFVPGVRPAGSSKAGHAYPIEDLLATANRHLEEWSRIQALVPDPYARYIVAAELPEEQFEVTLDGPTWLYLAELGGGSSVQEIADRLGVFEYPAAQQIADMVRRGLLVAYESSPESDDGAAIAAEAPPVTVTVGYASSTASDTPSNGDAD